MRQIQARLNILNLILAVGFILWCLGLLCIGAYYCNPNAEDLSLSQTSRDLGIIRGIANTMITYDGRYFTNLLHGINPLVFNWLSGYKLMPVFAIIFFSASFYFFITTLFNSSSKIKLVVLTLLFTVIYFATKPAVIGGPFVMIGTFVYLYPWTFTFLWVGSFLRYIHASESNISFRWFLITAITLVACIGLNEMFLVTNLILIFLIVYLGFKNGTPLLLKVLPIAIIGLGCILFFITSPGIQERAATFHSPGVGILNLPGIIQSISDFAFSATHLFANGILLIGALLATINTHGLSFRYKMFEGILQMKKAAIWTIVLFIIAHLMTLAYYIPAQIKTPYPFWVFNAALLPIHFIILVLLPMTLSKVLLIQKIHLRVGLKTIITSLSLVLLICLTLVTKNNISELKREFNSGILQNYNATMQSRYAAIHDAKNDDNCWHVAIIDSLQNPPSTIYFGPEICANRNPAQWNLDYEIYFDIDEVKFEGDTASKL